MHAAKVLVPFSVVISLALSSPGCSSDEGGETGISDTCNRPATDVELDSLEVGLVVDGEFSPFTDDEVVTLTYGLQGSAMIGLYLSASGAEVPECLEQTTLVYEGEMLAGDLFSPLTMYVQDDGSYRTETAWLILFPSVVAGDQLRLETEAGGQIYERRIFADERGDGQAR